MEAFLSAAAIRESDARWLRECAGGGLNGCFCEEGGDTRPFTIVWRPLVGRTLVATVPLPCGAVVFCEDPLVVATDVDDLGEAQAVAAELLRGGAASDVAARLLQAAQHPTARARAELREAAADLLEKRGATIAGRDASCGLKLAIWALGVAAVNTHGAHDRAVLGLLSSMPHHDCDPNCTIHVGPPASGSQLTLRTLRPVAAGEALCISYCPIYLPCAARRAQLYQQHGFVCGCRRCEGGHAELVRAFRCPRCGDGPASPTSPRASCRQLQCDKCGALTQLSDARWNQLEAAEAAEGVLSTKRLRQLHPFHHTSAAIIRHNMSGLTDAADRARAFAELAGGMARLTGSLGGAASLAAVGPSHPLLAHDLERWATAMRAARDPAAAARLASAAACWGAAGRAEEAARCTARLARWAADAGRWSAVSLGASQVHNSRALGLATDPTFLSRLGREPPPALAVERLSRAQAEAAGARAMCTRRTPAVVCGLATGADADELVRRCGQETVQLAPDVSLCLKEVRAARAALAGKRDGKAGCPRTPPPCLPPHPPAPSPHPRGARTRPPLHPPKPSPHTPLTRLSPLPAGRRLCPLHHGRHALLLGPEGLFRPQGCAALRVRAAGLV